MKTTIIQLEHHDDIISARDKMNWAKGGRILLVWPEGRAPLNRRLDLILLKRHSAGLGAPLALVSKDREVLYHAPRLGIPVFKSQRKAQDDNWRVPHRFRRAQAAQTEDRPEPPAAERRLRLERGERRERGGDPGLLQARTPQARLGFFALGVLAMLSIAAVLLPAAVIQVTPQTQVQDVALEVSAAPAIASVDINGKLPARWVQVTVEGRDALPASGAMEIPERAASGEIVFTNLTDQEVSVPAGTVALAPGDRPLRFATTKAGTLAPGPGTTITLPAEALEPGERGNLAAKRLNAIEGLIGAQVSASNPKAMSGGRSRSIPAPSAADRDRLAERLMASLEKTALQELHNASAAEDVVIESSLAPVQRLKMAFQPQEGQPAERLTLSLRMEYRALVASGEDLRRLAEEIFAANLPANTRPVEGSLAFENISPPQPAGGELPDQYTWQLHAHRTIEAGMQPEQIVRLALGRSPQSAAQKLDAQLPADEPARILMRPSWWPLLPILPFRIQVVDAHPGS